jgi:predicted O-methyltransferase YrrM
MSFSLSSLPFSNYRGARRLYTGLSVLSMMTKLRLMSRSTAPREIVNFALTHSLIQPAQVPSELHEFASVVAARKPKAVLEIGTFQGGTLMVLCRVSHPRATVISVDLPGGQFGGGYKWFHVLLFKSFTANRQRLHLLRKDSHKKETLEEVREILRNQRLDLLFIDADHTYDGVRADFELYSPLVQAGGLIAFHDIAKNTPAAEYGVPRLWNEIRDRYRYSEIIDNPDQVGSGLGLLYL